HGGVNDVRGMQERGTLQPDVDERRLHAGQHARDTSLVDIADEPATIGALDEDLLEHAVLDQRGAHLTGTDVDQNLRGHPPAPVCAGACGPVADVTLRANDQPMRASSAPVS